MTNAFKFYLHSGKYRVIDEQEFIEIAKDKVSHDDILKKQYLNKEINKLAALNIFKKLKIKTTPVNALLIETKRGEDPVLKTIEKIDVDIEKFIFEQIKEEANNFNSYFQGNKDALLKILEEDLNYKIIDEERTLEDFIDKEVYFTSKIEYKHNTISVSLTNEKFICDLNTQKIYKYKSIILDPEGYQFSFKKNELFTSREEAIEESKKLVDEHYNLPIRNSKIQKVIIRTDKHGTIIVFWPDIDTDNDYIMANDIIGTSDLAGDTKTSLLFFNECKDATPTQVKIAKDVIEKCMNLQTMNVRHL